MFKRLQKHFRYKKNSHCDCEPDSEWVAFFLSKASWLCSKISAVANTLAFVCMHTWSTPNSKILSIHFVSCVCSGIFFYVPRVVVSNNEWPTLCAYSMHHLLGGVGVIGAFSIRYNMYSIFIGLTLA